MSKVQLNNENLKVAAQCKAKIAELQTLIEHTSGESDFFETTTTPEEIRIFLHNQKIRALINHYKQVLEDLGLTNFRINDSLLENLNDIERKVFYRIYKNKESKEKISVELKLSVKEVQEYYKRSVKKVLEILSK